MNRRQFVGTAGALGLLKVAGTSHRAALAQSTYSSVDLGLPDGYDSVVPIALNDNGVAVVAADDGETRAIFTVAGGVFTRMGREESSAHATCIDFDGNVGGWVDVAGKGSQPAREMPIVLTAGNQSEMPGEPLDGRVFALRQGGTAVGEAAIGPKGSARKAVIWIYQEVQELAGTPKDGASAGMDVNGFGQVAGWVETGTGDAVRRTAVMFDVEGDMVEIGGLGGFQSEAVGISEQGHVVGHSTTSENDGELGSDGTAAFIWERGKVTPLLTLDGQLWSLAADVNSFGLVAGTIGLDTAGPTGATTTAAVWGFDAVYDLNLSAEPVDGITLTAAVAVNELGQVLCGGVDVDGKSHVILLSMIGN